MVPVIFLGAAHMMLLWFCSFLQVIRNWVNLTVFLFVKGVETLQLSLTDKNQSGFKMVNKNRKNTPTF